MPLWWVAFAVVVAVALDALTDPISGYLTDTARIEFRGESMRRRSAASFLLPPSPSRCTRL